MNGVSTYRRDQVFPDCGAEHAYQDCAGLSFNFPVGSSHLRFAQHLCSICDGRRVFFSKMGPFYVGIVHGKPMIVDAEGRVADRSLVEQILRAGLNLWDWSGGQIQQQHDDVARTSRPRGKK